MFYIVLAIIVAAALFLIFRDDHDRSYTKADKPSRKADTRPPHQPQSAKSQAPKPSPAQPPVPNPGPTPPNPLAQAQAPRQIIKPAPVPEQVPEDWEPDPEDWEDGLKLGFLENLDYYEDLAEDCETFDIAGLRYHCNFRDCGPIVGIVQPEPDNPHDPKAQAIISSDGKLLGYIPRTQQKWYEDFNPHNVVCPFVGEIELDSSTSSLIGEIKVIIPTSLEYVVQEIEYGKEG